MEQSTAHCDISDVITDVQACQGYVPLTLDVVRVAFKVPLALHTPFFSHGPEMFGWYTGFPWNPSGSWAVCSIYGALRQDCLARNVCHVGVVISR